MIKPTEEQIASAADEVCAAIFDADWSKPHPYVTVNHIGSTYVYGEGQDIDLLVSVDRNLQECVIALERAGYTYTGVDYGDEEDEFCTFRKGDVNIILTDDAQFAKDMRDCSEIILFLNSIDVKLDKACRVKLHRIVMNGESA